MGHHQEAYGIEVRVFGGHCKVLLSNIRFSTMRRHPNRRYATIHSHFKVINSTDAGQQQCGDLRVLHLFTHSRQILLVTGRRKTVIH